VLRALLFLALAGCGTLIGIEDEQPLACQSLSVIDNTGTTVNVTPAFSSTQTNYQATVDDVTTSVQVAIACSDADAAITANGTAVSNGRSAPITMQGDVVVIQLAVTAGTAPPAPSQSYQVTVSKAVPRVP